MNEAAQQLTEMAQKVYAEAARVREQYNSLALVQRLMARHNLDRAEDAIMHEAKMRILRNKWAEVAA